MMKTSKVPTVKVAKEVFICIRDQENSGIGATLEAAFKDYKDLTGDDEVSPDRLDWYKATPMKVESRITLVEKA